MAKKEKNGLAGIIVGPLIVLAALLAIWKNETRFNYHRAAQQAAPTKDPSSLQDGQNFSYTATIDRQLELPGDYVESFTGYLVVYRTAEIYAWDRDEDDDGNVTWSRRWMTHLENNSRNSGLDQRLSGNTLLPESYELGSLVVDSRDLQFVDGTERIEVQQLVLNPTALTNQFAIQDQFFYLNKGSGRSIGDERVSYQGIPIPEQVTFFGRHVAGRGVADDRQRRTNWISLLIQDKGILHHLVGGDRDQALGTMKAHLIRVKWMVRAAATFATVFGFIITFSFFARFLFGIPLVGRIAQWGAFALGVAIGLPVALSTILLSYIISHPLLLLAMVGLLAVAVAWVIRKRSRGKQTQHAARNRLENRWGHRVDTEELKTQQFIELVLLAEADMQLDEGERKVLERWAARQGWDSDKVAQMIEVAKQRRAAAPPVTTSKDRLRTLIEMSLADGTLSPFEIRTISQAARNVGYNQRDLNRLIEQLKHDLSA